MAVDCSSILHLALTIDAEACASARAALRAAEIQAKAIRGAGHLAFLAGLSALLAGGLAYLGARLPIREQRKRSEQREAAYCRFVHLIASAAFEDLQPLFYSVTGDILPEKARHEELARAKRLSKNYIEKLVREADPANWARQVYLGAEGQKLILEIPMDFKDFNDRLSKLLATTVDPPSVPVEYRAYGRALHMANRSARTLYDHLNDLIEVAESTSKRKGCLTGCTSRRRGRPG